MELGCAVKQECMADEEDSHYRWTNSRYQELGRWLVERDYLKNK